MSYDLPVKRCFNLDDHSEHSWEFKNELHICPGMGHTPAPQPAAMGTRNAVETSIELSKGDKLSSWEELADQSEITPWDTPTQVREVAAGFYESWRQENHFNSANSPYKEMLAFAESYAAGLRKERDALRSRLTHISFLLTGNDVALEIATPQEIDKIVGGARAALESA